MGKNLINLVLFTSADYHFDKCNQQCRCPAGNDMWCSGESVKSGERIYIRFTGYLKDCKHCPLQKQCMRKKPNKTGRQVQFLKDSKQKQTSQYYLFNDC